MLEGNLAGGALLYRRVVFESITAFGKALGSKSKPDVFLEFLIFFFTFGLLLFKGDLQESVSDGKLSRNFGYVQKQKALFQKALR